MQIPTDTEPCLCPICWQPAESLFGVFCNYYSNVPHTITPTGQPPKNHNVWDTAIQGQSSLTTLPQLLASVAAGPVTKASMEPLPCGAEPTHKCLLWQMQLATSQAHFFSGGKASPKRSVPRIAYNVLIHLCHCRHFRLFSAIFGHCWPWSAIFGPCAGPL